MSIEFIRDEFLEGKKEELDGIYEVLSKKPKIVDRKTLFLRRFTLALMGQYKVKKYLHEKHEEIERINKIIEQHTNELFKSPIPAPRVPIQKIQVPVPQLKIPIPMKKDVKIPEPITQEEKKEAIAPNPL